MSSPRAMAIARQRTRTLPLFFERNWRLFAEIGFIVPAYLAYTLVRAMVGGQAGTAFENATRVIHIEKQLGIFHEAFLQQLVLRSEFAVDLFNHIYVWGHLPVIMGIAVWLFVRHRDQYAFFRNAFLLSGLIALVGFTLMPLAPPRYMPEFGFVDTIVHAQSYYVFQNPKIVNQYAAMPSLHFGWDIIVVTAIAYNLRGRLRWLVVATLPLVTLSGIVLTANHYFLDAVAGGLVAAAGLGLALALRRAIPRNRKLSFLS